MRSLKRLTAAGTLRCYVVGGKVLRLKASDVEALIVPADWTVPGFMDTGLGGEFVNASIA